MFEETMPGATLEAPESFRVLVAPLWPRLPLAMGYAGPARWVALYVRRDDAIYTDGACLASGDTPLLLAYLRHRAVAPHLAGAHLGSDDEDAQEWLVIDQAEHLGYLAEAEEVRRLLAAQWPQAAGALEEPSAERAQRLEAIHSLAALPTWVERLAESVRERRANARLMQRWLDHAGTL
jgi:hypothetical protein